MALAANHYIRAGATGSNNGNDWTNAWTAMPGTFVRGDIYYVADGSYSGFSADTSESAAKYITIKKAISPDHGTDTGWQSAYGDGFAEFKTTLYFLTDYWILDGVTGAGRSDYGFKIKLQNCSGDSKLLRIDNGADFINISHVELHHCGMNNGQRQDCVYAVSSNDAGSSNITLSYCYMHDVNRVHMALNYITNSTIEHCYMENRSDTVGGIHGESISMNYCGTNAKNTIRYNIFKDIRGTGCVVIKDSVQGYFYVYGNVFYHTSSDFINTNGAITNTSGDTNYNMHVYNNTFVNLNGYNTGINWNQGSSNYTFNNIWHNCENVSFTNTTHDYNVFTGNNTYGEEHAEIGINNSIFLNYNGNDFRLTSATDPGNSDLGSPYNVDLTGQTRGADGNWDRGAYEYAGAGGNSPPDPPTGLKIITP